MRATIQIFTEDRYGGAFVKKLINRLIYLGFISKNISVKTRLFVGRCNPKVYRQVKAAHIDYDKIIILMDAHGRDVKKIEASVKRHIPKECREKVHIVILNYEIEEWICYGLGIKFNQKPSESLNEYLMKHRGAEERYEKYMLVSFADKINLNRLCSYPSFRNFLNALL